MKSLLIIFQSSPFSTAAGQEGLDAVLAAVAMDLQVSLLFMDEGVFHLTQKAHTAALPLRDYTKGFAALADLGIDTVVVDKASVETRGLMTKDLFINVEARTQTELNDMLAEHNRVLTF